MITNWKQRDIGERYVAGDLIWLHLQEKWYTVQAGQWDVVWDGAVILTQDPKGDFDKDGYTTTLKKKEDADWLARAPDPGRWYRTLNVGENTTDFLYTQWWRYADWLRRWGSPSEHYRRRCVTSRDDLYYRTPDYSEVPTVFKGTTLGHTYWSELAAGSTHDTALTKTLTKTQVVLSFSGLQKLYPDRGAN